MPKMACRACRMQMLDSLRYLIVWNPLMLICLHFVLHYIGFDRFSR